MEAKLFKKKIVVSKEFASNHGKEFFEELIASEYVQDAYGSMDFRGPDEVYIAVMTFNDEETAMRFMLEYGDRFK